MRDDLSLSGDLVGGQIGDWLVIGWFSEDASYRKLAETFAANLAEHGAPYHLFAKSSLGTWNTRRKPAVVLEAMSLYPGKTLVLCDVDCVIRGNISRVTQFAGDIGICAQARNVTKGRRFKHWLAFETSSRVVVFRPTEGASAFASKWAETVERSAFNHDEHSQAWALLSSLPTTRFEYIDQKYSGREVGQIEGAIIEHDSAHDEARRASRGRLKTWLRNVERRFLRTGKTRSARLNGEMSVLLKAN
jgi:hypothetical protein